MSEMTSKIKIAATFLLIVITLLYLASLAWLYRYIFYRQIILEFPLRFEQGFFIDHEFTVDIPANYQIGIRYDEVFRSTPANPLPKDEFTAESKVALGDSLIANGSTTTFPGWTGPWVTDREHVTRYLSSFHAEPGKKYSVSLRITRLLPSLVGRNPKLLVSIEPRFTTFYDLRKSVFLYIGGGVAIVLLVASACAVSRLRCKHNGLRSSSSIQS